MSEEDIDMLGPDGQGAKVDRDRRAPRFSWTPAYETTFFRSLCESVQLGLRENSSFKAEAWERAAQALQDSHGAYPTKNHLINKSDNARKRFRLWRGLREDPEFSYNSKTRTVTATEDAWKAHIDVRTPINCFLNVSGDFLHFQFQVSHFVFAFGGYILTDISVNHCHEPYVAAHLTMKISWRRCIPMSLALEEPRSEL